MESRSTDRKIITSNAWSSTNAMKRVGGVQVTTLPSSGYPTLFLSAVSKLRNIWIPFIIIFKINFRRYSTDLLADRTASSIAGHVRHFSLRCRLGFYFLLWVIFCYNCSTYLCSNLNWHCTDEPASSVLMEVQLPVVSQSKCTQAYRSYSHVRIDQSVLCAGLEAGGKDACRVSLCDKLIGKFTILPSFRVIRVVR